MFESMQREHRRSVVQPVLALALHAGVISMALGNHQVTPAHRQGIRTGDFVYVPVSGSPTTGLPSSGGTAPTIPVSDPIGMPDLTPFVPNIISVPLQRPGTFDPRRFLDTGPSVIPVPGTDSVLVESALTEPPRALHLAEPRYPEALRQAGFQGVVNVMYIVDAAGFVEPSSIRIVSSDHPAFAEAVMAAVGEAQFSPGRIHGRAVRVLVRQTFRFATRS